MPQFSLPNYQPKTKEEATAYEIARGLKDLNNLPFYLSYAKRYPNQQLWEIYHKVKAIPDRKIKKSKGALFNYLIQKHGTHT